MARKHLTPTDLIENKYTTTEIRRLYALMLSGRGKYSDFAAVPTRFRQQAGAADIEECVAALAKGWHRFRKINRQ